jgi:hypothetical protein
MQKALTSQGIQSAVHYPFPIHRLPAHEDLGYGRGDFPRSEKLSAEQLSLPIYPELSDQAVSRTARVLSDSARSSMKPRQRHRHGTREISGELDRSCMCRTGTRWSASSVDSFSRRDAKNPSIATMVAQ